MTAITSQYTKVLLQDVADNTEGAAVDVMLYRAFMIFVEYTGTGSADCKIQGKYETGDWFTLEDSLFAGVLTGNGTIAYDNAGLYQVRAVIENHTGSVIVNARLTTAGQFPFAKPPAGRFL